MLYVVGLFKGKAVCYIRLCSFDLDLSEHGQCINTSVCVGSVSLTFMIMLYLPFSPQKSFASFSSHLFWNLICVWPCCRVQTNYFKAFCFFSLQFSPDGLCAVKVFVCVMSSELCFHHLLTFHLKKFFWKTELDCTGLGLKSMQKGQTAAYLLCWPF